MLPYSCRKNIQSFEQSGHNTKTHVIRVISVKNEIFLRRNRSPLLLVLLLDQLYLRPPKEKKVQDTVIYIYEKRLEFSK